MSEWRDISTAPKMRTVILWAATDIAADGEIKNWKMDTGYWSYGHEAWIWEGRPLREWDTQPTHWQLLPEPPKLTPEIAAHLNRQPSDDLGLPSDSEAP